MSFDFYLTADWKQRESCSTKQDAITEEGKKILLELSTAERIQSEAAAMQWRCLFSRGKRKSKTVPLCKGHGEICLRRRVKREGSNLGREFWVCPRPPAVVGNLEGRCSTFIWINENS